MSTEVDALLAAAERASDLAKAARRRGRMSTALNHERKAAKPRADAARLAKLTR